MNKSIKYLGFAFLGSLLFFTLGALRPFIASLNGLGVSTTMSNSVMVGTFRSMLGTVTNMDMPNTAPQHVIFLPQTANTGEFDIGDPSQTTGRYLMFSKANASFLIGHDGTDAFRVNSANGTTYIAGPQTNNNNIDMNGYIQTWDGAGNKVLQIGNDPVHPKILSRGTDFELQSQFGDILLLPGANVTLNNGQFVGNGGGLTNLLNNNQLGSVTWFGTAPATNVLIDLSLGALFRFQATNNFTLIFTNGVDGQDFSVSVYQDATGNRTCPALLNNNTGGTQTNRVAFGSDITGVTLTTNALFWDHIKGRFNVGTAGIPNTTNKIDIIGFIRGYH